MSARHLPLSDYLALKAAFRRLVQTVGGSAEAGRITRVGQQAVDRYGSVNDDHRERFAPLDVIADLEAECGDAVVTRVLAEMSGHVMVALPVVPGSNARLDMVTGECLTEIGQAFAELGQARSDSRITPGEAEGLHTQIREAVETLLKLDRQVAAEAASEDQP